MRFVRALLFLTVSTAIWIMAGCGRSNIDDYAPLTDGGKKDGDANINPDGGPSCNPATCPNGCCDANGQCQMGTDIKTCGGGGLSCVDCVQGGFDSCDAQLRACKKIVPMCDVTSCPNGCCTTFGGMNVCLSGSSSLACGAAGQMCADCTQSGQTCDTVTHKCQTVMCGPQTCAGCCSSPTTCASGVQDTTCGIGGINCANCTAQMQFCNAGKCTMTPPQCNSQNCPNGCCAGNTCVAGTTDGQCGKGGQACVSCTAQQQVCTGQACVVPPCSPNNCTGCCSGNNCFGGFSNNSCGSGGANCANCTQQMSTCNTIVNPRVCQNMQMSCPQPYNMCPNNVTTPVLSVTKNLCSGQDLLDARAACLQGWGTLSCTQFWTFINQQKPNCGKCLNPFNFDFPAFTGIYNCVSPFVGSSCNHTTGCVSDCSGTSCTQCPNPGAKAQCETSVKQPQGQCFSFVQGSSCIAPALFGQGQFCSPAQYNGNYGLWIQGVGAHYCGP